MGCTFALVPLAWLGMAPSTIIYPFGGTEVVRADGGGGGGPARFMLAGREVLGRARCCT